MMSLFASFDMQIFWLSSSFSLFSMFFFYSSKTFLNFSLFTLMNLKLYKLSLFMFRKTKKNIPEFYASHLLSLFIFIFFFNFFSIGPYIFPLTSQLSVILILAMLSWMPTFVLFSVKNVKGFLLHLVPENSPVILAPMLVIIEFVSNIIRPLTLTIRLVANTVAGHVLMELYAPLGWKSFSLFMVYPLFSLVEMLVSIIQAYVFMMMSLLYLSELE